MANPEPFKCKVCGRTGPGVYFMCDERGGDWCEEHFNMKDCVDMHGEGCASKVFAPDG